MNPTMQSTVIESRTVTREKLDWGARAWLTCSKGRSAEALVVIEVELRPGCGHAFHLHPNQEEVLYCLEGTVEQWIGAERTMLHCGDSAFIAKNTVHASFSASTRSARVLAILGPVVGSEGYEVIEVAHQAPWNTLRQDAPARVSDGSPDQSAHDPHTN
jgi:quercetin dioxygenase-like cupin family protein